MERAGPTFLRFVAFAVARALALGASSSWLVFAVFLGRVEVAAASSSATRLTPLGIACSRCVVGAIKARWRVCLAKEWAFIHTTNSLTHVANLGVTVTRGAIYLAKRSGNAALKTWRPKINERNKRAFHIIAASNDNDSRSVSARASEASKKTTSGIANVFLIVSQQ